MGADELTATLCQASMTSVSMKRLTTVLGVAIALARAENITTREALLLLAKCAIGGSLPGRLFHAGSANDEGPAEIGQPVALAIWARIQKETRRRRFDVNPLPPMASTWMLHSDDLASFATSGAVSPAFGDKLLSPVPNENDQFAQAKQRIPAGPQTSTQLRTATLVHSTIDGRRNLLRTRIEQAQALAGGSFKAAEVWPHLERMASMKPAPAPLEGSNSGGIQYRDGTVKTFTIKALGDRLRRASKKLGKAR